MNALGRKAIEARVVAELRRVPASATITAAELRRRVAAEVGACSSAELAAAVQALRYQGKLSWDRLSLSPSMIETERAVAPVAAPAEAPPGASAADGPEGSNSSAEASGPDDEDDEDYPGGVNDLRPPRPLAPRRTSVRAGVHAANTRAASRPLPVPEHEPEVARQVREEVEALSDRRRRASSTSTVRQPLEIRKFGIPDLNLGEAIDCMLSQEPQAIMRAVQRTHVDNWRRVILLARATGRTPMQVLFDALERGLELFERKNEGEVTNAA